VWHGGGRTMLAVIDQVKLSHNKLRSLAGMGVALQPYLWRHDLYTVTLLDLSSNLLDRCASRRWVPLRCSLFTPGL
jgi:hypothetical protein